MDRSISMPRQTIKSQRPSLLDLIHCRILAITPTPPERHKPASFCKFRTPNILAYSLIKDLERPQLLSADLRLMIY